MTGRRQDLHPPHVSAAVGNLASELLSCALEHKCMCLSLPWKLISSTFCILLPHHHASGEVWDANMIDKFLLLPPPPCSSGFVFDNRWVVPYNPYLTM